MDSELREDRCETCRFWETYSDPESGRCRRNAPSVPWPSPGGKELLDDTVWPMTLNEDWCGEHQTRTGYGWQPVATVEEVMAVANSPPSA